jgi:murein DD-endopeptidase MepM/ murein hydrolase activator NlpD
MQQRLQEFDERLGSHSGPAAFCWDFERVTGATNGASVYAVADGEVNQVSESDSNDVNNLVEIQAETDEYHAYLHTRLNASVLTVGAQVVQGALVSVIGKFNHLHFNLGPGSGTRPLAFRNYERKEWGGAWTTVDIGMPRHGELVRRLGPPSLVIDAAFVSQTVPASTHANEAMNVSITMRNTGTSTWTQADAVRLGCTKPVWDVTPVALPVAAVAPGQTVTFEFSATWPSSPGSKAFQCRMQLGTTWFGEKTPSKQVLVLAEV